jgi:hypothetical protein
VHSAISLYPGGLSDEEIGEAYDGEMLLLLRGEASVKGGGPTSVEVELGFGILMAIS